MENYFFDTESKIYADKVFVLIIYDVVDNKRRNQLAKYLQGYGFRVQKSAFEAIIHQKKYHKLLRELPGYVAKEDSVKVYRIVGSGQVTSFGKAVVIDNEDIIII